MHTLDTDTLDTLLDAGDALAQLVKDLASDTRDSANGDPETEEAALRLQDVVDRWEGAWRDCMKIRLGDGPAPDAAAGLARRCC